MRRGSGWDDAHWAEQVPAVGRAVTKATAGMAMLGITHEQPKQGAMGRYTNREENGAHVAGRAFGPTHFQLSTVLEREAKPRLAQHAARWAPIILHEVVHCVRYEHVPDETNRLVEIAASEGLAYVADMSFARDYLGKPALSGLMEWEIEEPDKGLREAMAQIAVAGGTSTEHVRWFEDAGTHGWVRNGSLYGAQCVYRHVQRGHILPDLMRQPAEELLGL